MKNKLLIVLVVLMLIASLLNFSSSVYRIYKIVKITGMSASGTVKLIVTLPPVPAKVVPCVPQWICSDWEPEECPPSGKQTRVCVDVRGCAKIPKRIETRSCVYKPPLPPVPKPIKIEKPAPIVVKPKKPIVPLYVNLLPLIFLALLIVLFFILRLKKRYTVEIPQRIYAKMLKILGEKQTKKLIAKLRFWPERYRHTKKHSYLEIDKNLLAFRIDKFNKLVLVLFFDKKARFKKWISKRK